MTRRSFLAASTAGGALASSADTFGQTGGQTGTPTAPKTGYTKVLAPVQKR